MNRKFLGVILSVALFLTSSMTVFGLEEVAEAVDGNTRGIMFLVLLLGFGTIGLIGFYISATEDQEKQE